MKKDILYILTSLIVLSQAACKKFIEEDLVSTLTYEYYTTDQGLEDLVRSAYTPLRFKYESEQSYALWNFGTDEFILGDQFNFSYYNTYIPQLGPADGFINSLWVNNYDGINRCNLGIERIPPYSNLASKTLGTEAQKTQRVAELRFLRGYYYFQLVQQFGGVPIVLSSSSQVRTDFPRASVPDVYNVIISDLRYAAENLAVTTSDLGRATRGAANHFLAKAYLTRGSAVTDQRGQKPTDIDSAIYYADLVINSKTYSLEPDYANLWNGVYPTQTVPPLGENGSAPRGDYSKFQTAQASKEIILAAQFNTNLNLIGTQGNQTHLYFIMQYDNGIPGLVRTVDNFNGRPFRRLGPSDYAIDLYDRKNDSRFYKSFRTVYYSNTNSGTPVFTAADAPNPSLVGKLKFGIGDTAALFIVNKKSNPIPAADIAKYRYKVFARYILSPTGSILTGYSNNKYLTLVKHLDPVRVTNNFNEQRGVRAGILARFAETYLIAAEAYGRKGDYAKALEYVNIIRLRAAYHQGETKNPQYWMFEGGTQGDVASTFPEMMATDALFTTNAPSELYPPTVTSTADRFIHFMLNEKTRELCGEFYRWEDLVRTETLYDRTKLYNKDATSIQPFHKLRPIPQTQVDLTTEGGQPLTPEQKKNYQNPGY
ncbi:RagB/SusD family nutrient uptake outer membrane protein [Chitinophagaceae bacterium LB-8]|uniref:RagB/SusD family nutrient uptake outer membrane protein n=1 Tax=Paraflavisolibacter caeni TaxID=2982496 RepID=A0A9X2XWN7_9BACT|nr:RagB/SusD family nutrient uptake outer membrane protein [Paraflavisolibacter caeni]MCU7550631.1 RagB/SusD family nutrient uptake outer membrane protein [Paraflavisolibacter caeni]